MYFIGDIHGNFNGLIRNLNEFEIKNENLIQVGDFGIGFRSEKDDLLFMKKINDDLLSNNNRLFVIRGNHDDPKFFDGSIVLSNLSLLPDYSILNLEGKTLLLVGGAISIDRTDRRVDLNYWQDEIFKLDVERINSLVVANKIDIVVTHTAPSFVFPQGSGTLIRFFTKKDKTLPQELLEERKLLDKFHAIVTCQNKPTHWYYGHFHNSNIEIIDGIKFCLLNIDEMSPLNFNA